ncbi:MAG: alpha/beta hydrolase [Proteobacteria bacterium]|nr:alpha/beta hydrolase [Pseudomonadota bacterium]MDA1033504.1 alpha/beta hydrolase [Pseudomonadota bacterium]
MLTFLGVSIAVLIAGGLALQIAIWRNGPAVLDAVDRITGGARGAVLAERVSYGPNDKQYISVYTPKDLVAEPLPVIVFVHGGSWNKGDPENYSFIGRAFAPEGFVVVLVAYRLHPEAVYPAMIEDTAAAIAWTQANITKHGGDPSRIVISGHSAGAYNVAMTALEARWLTEAGGSAEQIAGVVGLAGPYDFYPFDSDSTRASFGHVPQGEVTQPVTHVRDDAPPTLLVHGEADMLVEPRNSRELAKRLESAGSKVETLYLKDADHNQPLLALASPWRSNSKVFRAFVEFARDAHASVPVQDGMR